MEAESMGDGDGDYGARFSGENQHPEQHQNSEENTGMITEIADNFREALLKNSTEDSAKMEEEYAEDGIDMDDFEIEEVDVPEGSGIPVLRLSKQERKHLWKPWVNSLIIKVLGKFLPYNFLVQRLHLRWRIKGDMKVIDIGNGYFLVLLPSWEDRARVLSEGPWIIAGHYLSVQGWRPEFDPFMEKIKRMAVWVRLPYLPFEYYNTEILTKIGNMLGKMLKIDRTTELANRGKFARLFVEMDVSKLLIPKFVIGGRYQKVEYERVGTVCFHCGCIEHKDNECDKVEKEVISKEVGVDCSEEGNSCKEHHKSQQKEGNFGPWLVVQNKKRLPYPKGKDTGSSKEITSVNSFHALDSEKDAGSMLETSNADNGMQVPADNGILF